MGLLLPVGLDADKEGVRKAYHCLTEHVLFGSCSWEPGYVAMALARLGEREAALEHLNRHFDPAAGYTKEPWVTFRESDVNWIKGGLAGRMPYYLAAPALFVQAINEMLLQDWQGKVALFPACPFAEASFRLTTLGRVVEATKRGRKVRVLHG